MKKHKIQEIFPDLCSVAPPKSGPQVETIKL